MFEEIKRGICEDVASEHFNSDIWKLRLAFLQSEDVAYNIRQTICELLRIIKQERADKSLYSDGWWKWYHWHRDRFSSEPPPFNFPHPDYQEMPKPKLEKFLNDAGISNEMLNEPMEK
jgi:hypothetical protein